MRDAAGRPAAAGAEGARLAAWLAAATDLTAIIHLDRMRTKDLMLLRQNLTPTEGLPDLSMFHAPDSARGMAAGIVSKIIPTEYFKKR